MRFPAFLLSAAAVISSGCFPGAIPPLEIGNTATEAVPQQQQDAENSAPVFHINVYANPAVNAVGRDKIAGEAADADGSAVGETKQLPAALPSLLAPRNKGDQPTLVGPIWNGATVDDFNRMVCDGVDLNKRVSPVAPVFEGCKPYWNQ